MFYFKIETHIIINDNDKKSQKNIKNSILTINVTRFEIWDIVIAGTTFWKFYRGIISTKFHVI